MFTRFPFSLRFCSSMRILPAQQAFRQRKEESGECRRRWADRRPAGRCGRHAPGGVALARTLPRGGLIERVAGSNAVAGAHYGVVLPCPRWSFAHPQERKSDGGSKDVGVVKHNRFFGIYDGTAAAVETRSLDTSSPALASGASERTCGRCLVDPLVKETSMILRCTHLIGAVTGYPASSTPWEKLFFCF